MDGSTAKVIAGMVTIVTIVGGATYFLYTEENEQNYIDSFKDAQSIQALMDRIIKKRFYLHEQKYIETKNEEIDPNNFDEGKYQYLAVTDGKTYGFWEVEYKKQLLSTKENIEGFENKGIYNPTKENNIDDEIFVYGIPDKETGWYDYKKVNYATHMIYGDINPDADFLGITDDTLYNKRYIIIDSKDNLVIDTTSNKVAVKE
jgi:hypothetical protein